MYPAELATKTATNCLFMFDYYIYLKKKNEENILLRKRIGLQFDFFYTRLKTICGTSMTHKYSLNALFSNSADSHGDNYYPHTPKKDMTDGYHFTNDKKPHCTGTAGLCSAQESL